MKHETELIELLDPSPAEASGTKATVTAGELFRADAWRKESGVLPLMLGKGMDGEIVTLDLTRAPHLLIAGSVGSGKSAFLGQCLFSLMFRHAPENLQLILVDPLVVEFAKYRDLPYLQFPVITNAPDTLKVLHGLNAETERRYQLLAEANCRDIRDLNAHMPNAMPYIVLFINELSDIMLTESRFIEQSLALLCDRGLPVGIHLVTVTQRLDSRVLTDSIKASFQTKIAFGVLSATDSRTILGCKGAELLRGRGDMLCRCSSGLQRIQGGYIHDDEFDRLLERLRAIYTDRKGNIASSMSTPEAMSCEKHARFLDGMCDASGKANAEQPAEESAARLPRQKLGKPWRALAAQAVEALLPSGKVSMSRVQRALGIGYHRAEFLLDILERRGIVSPQSVQGTSSFLVSSLEEAKDKLQE